MELLILATAICLILFYGLGKYFIDKVRKAMPKDLDELFRAMDKFNTRDFMRVRLLHKNVVVVNNPQLIHRVLASDICLEKPQLIYKLLCLNQGLLASKLSLWRHDRRHFNSAFNNSMVQCFIPTFCTMADKMVAKLTSQHLDGSEFDVIHFTERCTIEMIFASSFNALTEDVENGEDTINKIAKCVKTTSSLLSERFRYFPWFFDCIFKLSSLYHQEKIDRDFMFDTLMNIIARKSKYSEAESFEENTFLKRLLMVKDEMTENQMKEHIFTIGGAGYETTGTASAHCILFLALHPEIQEKAYQEILSVFPFDSTPITHQSMSQLSHVERIMKESLRLSPTVHAIARQATEDFEMSPGEIVRKGSIFVINIYALHRRIDLWGDDANKFNPDRFTHDNFSEKQQKSYIPFSAGKRNCIGYRYALVSFKIMLLKLLRNFKFSTTLKLSEIQFNRQIALKLVGKHLVQIEKRNHE